MAEMERPNVIFCPDTAHSSSPFTMEGPSYINLGPNYNIERTHHIWAVKQENVAVIDQQVEDQWDSIDVNMIDQQTDEIMEVIKHENITSVVMKIEAEEKTNSLDVKIFQCANCNKSYSDRTSFNQHKKTHSEEAFVCHFCGERFLRKASVRAHIHAKHLDLKPFVCAICQQAFIRRTALFLHNRCEHKLKLVSCVTCGDNFKSLLRLSLHEKMHKKRNPTPCTICDKVSMSQYECGKHMRRIHNSMLNTKQLQNPTYFTCEKCGRSYSSHSSLMSHSRTHTDRAFTCEICNKSFMVKYALAEHIIGTHLRIKPHKCKFCNKRFVQKTALTLHTRKHTGVNLFSCALCPKKFTFQARLSRHMLIHTGEKPYQCPHCPLAIRDKSNLDKHIMRKHNLNADVNNFTCAFCGESFPIKGKLLLHMATHTGEHPYKCLQCNKMFSSKASLKTHLKAHLGLKPFKCEICGKGCRDIVYHMRVHNDERPFNCLYCEKKFRSKNHMELHMRIHTGLKPYTCSECSKQFSFKSNLNAHIRIHSGEKNFVCTLCGKAFPYQSGLRRHTVAEVCTDKIRNVTLPTLLRPKVLSNSHSADPNKKIYECERCQKEFYHKSSFNRHNKVCLLRYDINAVQDGININKFKCDTCGRCYKNRSSLSMHRRMHLKKFITCGICSKPFIRKSHYKEHMLSKHSKVKPFRCRFCGISFHLKHILQRHARKVHGQAADPSNYDTYIEGGNNFAYEMTNEIISNFLDSGSNKPFKCKECGRSYKSKSTYEKHQAIHTNKSLCCSTCGKAFNTKKHLEEHEQKVHMVTRPEKPAKDTFKEAVREVFKEPITYQTRVESYKCMYCEQTFLRKHDLDQHMDSHWSITTAQSSGAIYATNTTMQDSLGTSYTFQPAFQKATHITQIPTYTLQRAYWEDPNDTTHLTANTINVAYEAIAMDHHDHISLDDEPGGDVIYVIDAQHAPVALEALPPPEPPPPPPPPPAPVVETKPEKPYRCEECHRSYATEKSLRTHKMVHAGKSVDCVFCGKAFAPKVLRSHVKSVHMTVKMLKCPICLEFFTKKRLLDEHLKIHMDQNGYIEQVEQEIPVSVMGQTTQSIITPDGIITTSVIQAPDSLQSQVILPKKSNRKMKKPVVEKPYKCFDCGKSYYTRTSLSTHRRVHTGKALVCVFCQKQFIKRHQLKDHVTAVHMRVKNYQCEQCHETFARKNSLDKHVRSHLGPQPPEPGATAAKPFKCPECDKCFGSKNYVNEHMKLHTGRGLPCDRCGKVFTKEKSLRDHVMAMHTHIRPFVCDFCGRAFTQKSNYNLHRRKHTGEKLRECHICSKKFTSQAPLRRHLRSHTGQKPYDCPQCEKTFSDQSNLKKHISVHTGQKRYHCEICDAGFNVKASYANHMISHDPNAPESKQVYECNECTEAFRFKSHLIAHKRQHRKEKKPFICSYCNKGFQSKSFLINHMKMHFGMRGFNCDKCNKTFATKNQITVHMKLHLKKICVEFNN